MHQLNQAIDAQHTVFMTGDGRLMLVCHTVQDSYAQALIEQHALIINWCSDFSIDSIKERIEAHYIGSPLIPMPEGSKIVNGRYTYPEDPDLSPIFQIMNNETSEVIVFYPYSIAAIYENNNGRIQEPFITRID